jgi:DNA-binding HxlR family transcriptional regulator
MKIIEKQYTRAELEARYLQYNTCPVSIAVEKIGGKWKPIILYLISHQYSRFGEMLKMIDGISKTMLTSQLRELEQDGIIHRKVFAEVPPKVEYTLTELGMTLRPVLLIICHWALDNLLEEKASS